MPRTKRGVQKKINAEEWRFRERSGRGGGREYHISSLPPETQRALRISQTKKRQASTPDIEPTTVTEEQELVALSELPAREQARIRARVFILDEIESLAVDSSVERAIREFVEKFNRGEIVLPVDLSLDSQVF